MTYDKIKSLEAAILEAIQKQNENFEQEKEQEQ